MAETVIENILSTVDVGEKTLIGLDVEDVGAAMQRFGWADYVMFFVMLLICIVIGIYFGFINTSKNSQDYLVGGRTMSIFPVGMSLIASYVSGISLLGIPTEIYVYGIQYTYIIAGFFLMVFPMMYIYLPVFHGLELTSTYEYHERRFDKKVRVFGSVLFTLGVLSWVPLVIYVPALAFNQVTGVNVHLVTPTVCLICIFYTSMGGLKAVVWTDVIQIISMIGAIILVAVKGTIDVGGIQTVMKRNWESGRIEGPNFDLDPRTRHTVWSLVIGGFMYSLQTAGVNQNMIQRYLALPTLRAARIASWVYFVGMVVIVGLCSYCGLLLYATFSTCDPLTTRLAREKDQLLPLLVMETLGDYPGLPGVFVAGIFSAALSSLSTCLNAMAAVVLEDFYKPFFQKQLNEKQKYILLKGTVIILGAICVGLVFIVEKLGAVLQLTMSVGAIASGPALSIFTMGILIPWVNARGALAGGISSLTFMSWLVLRTQILIVSGDLNFPEKPVATNGCHYDFVPRHTSSLIHLDPSVNVTDVTHTDERYMIYRLSYLWYTLVGIITGIAVALPVSFLTKRVDPRDVDPKLLAPFVRKLIKPREFPNEPADGIIYAYGLDKMNNSDDKNASIDNSNMQGEDLKRPETT